MIRGIYRRFVKPFADRFCAVILMLAFSPILLILAGAVWISLGRPILFTQVRPGLSGKLFTLLKFRTMRSDIGDDGRLLPDEGRMTPFGQFLRASSLDELPELLNVLKGEMSLVGPRPLLVQYLERYSPEQMRRHEVKPGITGWAQVMGRNAISWEEKFKLDVWYVDNVSFFLDLKILVLTIWKTLKREGINQPGAATAEEFMGSTNSDS